MVTAAGVEGAAAVDKGRGPVGPSFSGLAVRSPVLFPPVQTYRTGHVRAGVLGLSVAPITPPPLSRPPRDPRGTCGVPPQVSGSIPRRPSAARSSAERGGTFAGQSNMQSTEMAIKTL